MPTQDARSLKDELHQGQYKLTRPRQAILDVITEASGHLSPAVIHARARERCPRLGLATVYRTLDLLVELGCIQRVHGEDGCHSYAAALRPHGHHLVCSRCGRAEEFADCDLDDLVQELQSRTGYRIDGHLLELFGRCPTCQQQGGTVAASSRLPS